jgi:hypothetical protein
MLGGVGGSARAQTTVPNLAGEWKFSHGGVVGVVQTGDKIVGTWVQGNTNCRAGSLYFEAVVSGYAAKGTRTDCTTGAKRDFAGNFTEKYDYLMFDLPGIGNVHIKR